MIPGASTAFLRGYRAHTLLCRGSGLPRFVIVAPANHHDGPFARPLLIWALRLYGLHPRVVRLDAAYWGWRSSAGSTPRWTPSPSSPGTPSASGIASACRPPGPGPNAASAAAASGASGASSASFGLQRPPVVGWTAVAQRVALTYAATIVVALIAHHADRPDLIRSPKRVLAHLWEGHQ